MVDRRWAEVGGADHISQVFVQMRERRMTVWIYVDTSKQVGDPDHLKVFANQEAAQAWFAEHDPEGVAFEYEVFGRSEQP
jgi:hypothetical protein